MDINTYLDLSQKNMENHRDVLRSDYEEYVFLWMQQNMPNKLSELKTQFDSFYSQLYATRENEANQTYEFQDIPF